MGNLILHLDLDIKFRAVGVTFTNVSQHAEYPLPPIVQAVGPWIGNVIIARYHDHGVSILLSLKHEPVQPTPAGPPPAGVETIHHANGLRTETAS